LFSLLFFELFLPTIFEISPLTLLSSSPNISACKRFAIFLALKIVLQKLISDVENVCAKTDETLLDEKPGGC
jgi:hypothetical protein